MGAVDPPRYGPALMRRDWSDARAKVTAEARCRVCGSTRSLQAAHTLGRRYDEPLTVNGEPRGDGMKWVNPRHVVPLCGPCHLAFDAFALDLLPYLTVDEQAAMVEQAGLIGALRRATGSRDAPRVAV